MKKTYLSAALYLVLQSALSAQCISQPACLTGPVTYCDVSPNDTTLWNTPAFYDPATARHDLGETTVELSGQVTASCGAADVQVSFLLFLDLNGDGSRETVVSSAALNDSVYVGNAANPNYSGGVARPFDDRPVSADNKYRFTLEKQVQGNMVMAWIRWNTVLDPGIYANPKLPYGVQRVEWRFEQNGEVKTCGYDLIIKDCKAPTVVCKSGLSVSVLPTQIVQLWATDFLQYAEDNHTPAAQLRYGLRRSGTGTGFPVDGNGEPITSVTFTCNDLGTQPVELWTIDQAGNAEYCETYGVVQDNNSNCMMTPGLEACAKYHCNGAGIEGVSFSVGNGQPVPPFPFPDATDSTGCITLQVPIAANATVTPEKDDNPLNGVTTYDLVLISRHILGLEPLGTPFKMIAADANRSGSITTFDIVELRKLILGVYQELPNNTSWRFVPQAFVFPNPNNPFQTQVPYSVSGPLGQLDLNFAGIKIGDVNCSALNLTGPQPPEETLLLPNLNLQAGDSVDVPVQFLNFNQYYGYQFGFNFDPARIKVLAVEPVQGDLSNFGLFADHVNTSWATPQLSNYLPGEPIFSLRVQALVPVHLADEISLNQQFPAEAYPANDSLFTLALQFATVATGEPANNRIILAPQPNPTAAGTRIPLRLEEPATVTVEVCDATGRLTYRLAQRYEAGANALDLPAAAFPQTGMYLWRVQAGAAFRAGKIVRQ